MKCFLASMCNRARAIALAWMCGLLAACTTQAPAGIQPVHGFDAQRYLGRWYEIARLDHAFERGLTDVSATYEARSDGGLTVINRGYDASSATWKSARGRAYFNGPTDVASLKVSFFGPFFGGYHVVALDTDYRWAMVVGNDRGYLWILSRIPQLADSVKAGLVAQADRLGFDTGKLVWVPQEQAIRGQISSGAHRRS